MNFFPSQLPIISPIKLFPFFLNYLVSTKFPSVPHEDDMEEEMRESYLEK